MRMNKVENVQKVQPSFGRRAWSEWYRHITIWSEMQTDAAPNNSVP